MLHVTCRPQFSLVSRWISFRHGIILWWINVDGINYVMISFLFEIICSSKKLISQKRPAYRNDQIRASRTILFVVWPGPRSAVSLSLWCQPLVIIRSRRSFIWGEITICNSVFTHHLNSYLQYLPTLINMTKCFGRDEKLI